MTQIIIKTHHVDITDSIREYVEKKLSKLDHFFDKIEEIQVDLDVETFPNQEDRQIVSSTVLVPGAALIAKAASQDLYASVDAMADKLQRQIKKYKDKLRLKNSSANNTPPFSVFDHYIMNPLIQDNSSMQNELEFDAFYL